MTEGRLWEADPEATFTRRLGKHPTELDDPPTNGKDGCPDVWELSNGDVAVIGVISRTPMLGAYRRG